MKENFNTYIDHIEPDFWGELCVKDIVMRSSEAVFSTVYDRYMALYCKSPQQR